MGQTWHSYDAGFFTLEIPPGWVADQPNTATLLLHDRESQLSMALVTVSKDAPPLAQGTGWTNARPAGAADAQGELQKWMESQKHVRLRQAPRIVTGARMATACSEGVRVSPAGSRWYQRLFRRDLPDVWRFWAIVNPRVGVLASCNGPAAAMERERPAVDRLIGSLCLPEREILLGRRFTDMVVSLARSWFPQTDVAAIDDVHVQFGSQNLSLVNLHRRYLASPEELPTQVRAFLAAVHEEMPLAAGAGPWQRAREKVMPVFIRGRVPGLPQGPAREEWVNGLSIGFALQDPEAVEGGDGGAAPEVAVTRGDLTRWQIGMDDLRHQALENLVSRSHEHMMEGRRAAGYSMLCLAQPDLNNAVRLLLPDLHQKLSAHLGGTFLAAIPTRDALLAFNVRDPDVLKTVRQEVEREWARGSLRGQAGLSPRLFVVTRDGIAGDPAEQGLSP